jgi:hypothetical protein
MSIKVLWGKCLGNRPLGRERTLQNNIKMHLKEIICEDDGRLMELT